MHEFIFQIQRFGGWLIGLIGIVLSLFSAWDLTKHFTQDQSALSWLANAYILFVVTVLLLALVVRQYQTIRKEKYANIAPLIHMAMHAARDAETFLRECKPGKDADQKAYESHFDSAQIKFGHVLDALADMFRGITSTHCRVSIKLLYEHDNELYFYTYARDQGSVEKWRTLDVNRINENHDPLNKNLRFAELFSEDEHHWHYFCNNLADDKEFKTTSMTAYKPDHGTTINSGSWGIFGQKWPLPYRSTITCVIRQGGFDLMRKRRSEVLGFLTLDSESRGVFVEKWDVQLAFSVADALFLPLKEVISTQFAAENKGFSVR